MGKEFIMYWGTGGEEFTESGVDQFDFWNFKRSFLLGIEIK